MLVHLALASANATVPAGELLFVYFVPVGDVGGAAKRKAITTVLSWSSSPVDIPPDLDAVLDRGLAGYGPR